ncbi:hypothetical protein KUTeg_019423 [Tegillarca granosa]|uniref:AXH domain-containing protein n=1 Tax=Tegillarca granosa TaxID=220873 RepID=A0ABQ9EHH3_TEGGR|nr:hypothetical protein KUTeg_019423 [Tegillarca granosa]
MSTGNHGQDTSRMTGSSRGGNTTENLSWLANVATSQNQLNQQPSEGMLSGRSTGQSDSASIPSAMLASVTSPGVFRPPQSVADPTQRLISNSGQYATLYSGGSSSVSPYSSLHGGQVPVAAAAAQGSPHLQSVSPYSGFFPQFATHGFSHRPVLSPHFPHIESYSAVLQSMGSQVQHGVQAQLPRNTYLPGHVPQYSLVTVEATLEHPFFVFGQGWSACEPERTRHRYSLECHRLTVGDVCVSLTHKEAAAKAAELSKLQLQQQTSSSTSLSSYPSTSLSRTISSNKSTPDVKSSNVSSFSNQRHEVPSISDIYNKHSGTMATSSDTSDQYSDSSRPPRKRNWSSSQDSYNHKDS